MILISLSVIGSLDTRKTVYKSANKVQELKANQNHSREFKKHIHLKTRIHVYQHDKIVICTGENERGNQKLQA